MGSQPRSDPNLPRWGQRWADLLDIQPTRHSRFLITQSEPRVLSERSIHRCYVVSAVWILVGDLWTGAEPCGGARGGVRG
eukprot:CAMPEP_0114560532 /NCGR_PEP_ID=MMETSP0114-20121206/11509_1 /TAXON_ID=31324 /ORGANISM="Goniomonas sp, Strain m" /LENGTH=79 /DNA_ID=CAMNT_0001746083 /DNA_START=611 /DNA_END=847 /DNA_ORIENTATION=-